MTRAPGRFQGTLDPDQTGACFDAARRVRVARFVGNPDDENGSIIDFLADERTLPDNWIIAEMVDDLPEVGAEVIRRLVGLDDTPPIEGYVRLPDHLRPNGPYHCLPGPGWLVVHDPVNTEEVADIKGRERAGAGMVGEPLIASVGAVGPT